MVSGERQRARRGEVTGADFTPTRGPVPWLPLSPGRSAQHLPVGMDRPPAWGSCGGAGETLNRAVLLTPACEPHLSTVRRHSPGSWLRGPRVTSRQIQSALAASVVEISRNPLRPLPATAVTPLEPCAAPPRPLIRPETPPASLLLETASTVRKNVPEESVPLHQGSDTFPDSADGRAKATLAGG